MEKIGVAIVFALSAICFALFAMTFVSIRLFFLFFAGLSVTFLIGALWIACKVGWNSKD